MALKPWGVLHKAYRSRLKKEESMLKPPQKWLGTEAEFVSIMETWLEQVADSLWPAWENGTWVGAAATDMDQATRFELELATRLYYGDDGHPDILESEPSVPPAPDGRSFTHEWHYKIEDALVLDLKNATIAIHEGQTPSFDYRASRDIGSNYLVYDPTIDMDTFDQGGGLFWGRQGEIRPPISHIKDKFQRPRPWTVARGLDIDGFRWTIAGGFHASHTGMHPSLLSGHCVQGLLGGCSVIDAWLNEGPINTARQRAIQKYMVDWGDRRVFAGVHYMTDNIASWTLARRLIPHLFVNDTMVEALAVEAITRHSRVFSDIVDHFPETSPARIMLLETFPEAAAVA